MLRWVEYTACFFPPCSGCTVRCVYAAAPTAGPTRTRVGTQHARRRTRCRGCRGEGGGGRPQPPPPHWSPWRGRSACCTHGRVGAVRGGATQTQASPCSHCALVWQALNCVLVLCNVQDGHTRDFAYAALQVAVTGRNDVAAMLHHTLHYAVIRVSAFVSARKPLETVVLGDPESHSKFWSKFFQLRHHTVSNVDETFSVKAIHHGLDDFKFVLDGEVDEVGIYDDVVRWTKRIVVAEKHRRGDFSNDMRVLLLLLLRLLLCLLLWRRCKHTLHLRKLACFLRFSHSFALLSSLSFSSLFH
mmetsp:Transcript_43631/g.110062  ORF Transcript_43631/g.110062 Transcript_43631/m.110062 type:complete len:301 (-) Transcript_43631:16-918(-)